MGARKRSWRWLWRLAPYVVGAGLGSGLQAQPLQVCSDVNSATGYKVLLDDISFNAGAAGTQDRQLMDLLRFQLNGLFGQLDDAPPSRLTLIRCAGRSPGGEASFPPMIAEGLVNRDVVLEMWGEVFPQSAGKQTVFLNYAMLPLPAATGGRFLQRQYQPLVGSADDVVSWLASLNELTAYAMVARAVRALNNDGFKAFDSAKAQLEAASASLKLAFGTSPSPAERQLLAFVGARKCQILRDASTDARYHGPLRQLPKAVVAAECPPGGNP